MGLAATGAGEANGTAHLARAACYPSPMFRAFLVLACLGASTVHAQAPTDGGEASSEGNDTTVNDNLGRAEFLHGREAYGAGRYEEALTAFTRSYSLTGRKALLYNIGLAHDRLRHDDEALAAFREYLEHTPNSPYRDQVEGRISALDRAISERDAATREREQSEAARQAAIEAELERTRRQAEEARVAAAQARATEEPKRSLWWIGLIAGVVAIGVGVGVGVAVANSDDEPSYANSDFGQASFVLRSP